MDGGGWIPPFYDLAATAAAVVLTAAAAAPCSPVIAASAEDDYENENDPDTRVVTAHICLSIPPTHPAFKLKFLNFALCFVRLKQSLIRGFCPVLGGGTRRLRYTMYLNPELLQR